MKNTVTHILALGATVSVLVCVYSFLPIGRYATNPHAIHAALIPLGEGEPVSEAQISEITITHKDDFLCLQKQGTLWTVTTHDYMLLANTERVEAFIHVLIKKRKMYKFSYSNSGASVDVDNFRLSIGFGEKNNTGYPVNNDKKNINMSKNVYVFTTADSLASPVVQLDWLKGAFSIERDISPYCTLDARFFASDAFFWGISTPIAVSGSLRTDSMAYTVSLDEATADFESRSHALLSLRHGGLLPLADELHGTAVATLSVSDATGRMCSMQIYKSNEAAATLVYQCVSCVTPSPADGEVERQALSQCRFKTEISAWTFNRLCELLNVKS